MHSLDHVSNVLFCFFFLLIYLSFNDKVFPSFRCDTMCLVYQIWNLVLPIQNPYLHSAVCHNTGALCRHDCFSFPLSIFVFKDSKDASENLRRRNLDFRTSRNPHFPRLKFRVHLRPFSVYSWHFLSSLLTFTSYRSPWNTRGKLFLCKCSIQTSSVERTLAATEFFDYFLREDSEWSKHKG